jgi:hypothetical protein
VTLLRLTPVAWLVIVTVAPPTTAPLLSVTVPSKLAPYCAWASVVNATMLTISSATRTAKLERLMESPRIERVLFVLLQCKLRYVANHGPTGLLNLWKSDLVNNRRMLIARLNFGGQALNRARHPAQFILSSFIFYLWKCRGGYEKR